MVLIVISFIGSLAHSQKITVRVTEVQEFMKWGKHDFRKVVVWPDETKEAYKTDAEYVFDLENKTFTFSTGSRGITSHTIKKIKKSPLYTFNCSFVGEMNGKMTEIPTTICLNTDANLMWYTTYDKFFKRTYTLAYKGEITLN